MFLMQDLQRAARTLRCELAAITAVTIVESPRGAFDEKKRPSVLFEAHIFWRELRSIGYTDVQIAEIAKKHPRILCREWRGIPYGTYREQWDRLETAATIDKEAAYRSASFGAFQILGNNCREAGFITAVKMAEKFAQSELAQLDGFISVVLYRKADENLRMLDWAGFAKRYNGSGYAANQYDKKLAAAYEACKRMENKQKELAQNGQMLA